MRGGGTGWELLGQGKSWSEHTGVLGPHATGRKALLGLLVIAQVTLLVALQCNLKNPVLSVTGFLWKVVKALICSKLGILSD